jgi:drug/metabolite transporter (DMT)-like permease
MEHARMNTRDRLLAIVACLLWSTAFAAVKVALAYMSPLNLAGIRFILAGLMLLPWAGGLASLGHAWGRHRRTVLLAALFNTVGLYAVFFLAMQYVRGAQAAIMIGSSPLVYAVVAHVVMDNDRLTRRTLTSIGFAIAGVVMLALAGKPWEPMGARELGGLGLLFCGSLIGACGNVVVAKGKAPDLHPAALTCLQMIIGGVVLLTAGVALEGLPSLQQPVRFYAVLGWMAFLSAGAFSIWFHLLQRVQVSQLNLWKFLIPLAGAILSWVLLKDEHPDIFSACGMALVTMGIIWSQGKRPCRASSR